MTTMREAFQRFESKSSDGKDPQFEVTAKLENAIADFEDRLEAIDGRGPYRAFVALADAADKVAKAAREAVGK